VSFEETAEKFNELIRVGRQRGHVFFDEIDTVLSPGRQEFAELDAILAALATAGIEVFDEPRTEGSVPDESFFDQEEFSGSADSALIGMYLREVLAVPRLTAAQERELAREIRLATKDAELAEKQLIEANLWIALATATHFLNRGLGPIELIQEGNIGVMRAVKDYNYTRQYTFRVFATWWVRKTIRAAIAGMKNEIE
jgi:RNA polymerase primary sigma factor